MSLNSAFIIIATSAVSLGLFVHQNISSESKKLKTEQQVVVVKEGMRVQENLEQEKTKGRKPASLPLPTYTGSILSSKNP